MAVDQPPIQQEPTPDETNRAKRRRLLFHPVWVKWFNTLRDEINTIDGGSP